MHTGEGAGGGDKKDPPRNFFKILGYSNAKKH